jgi:hypothetical protein
LLIGVVGENFSSFENILWYVVVLELTEVVVEPLLGSRRINTSFVVTLLRLVRVNTNEVGYGDAFKSV